MMKLAVPENHFAQKNENQLDSAIKSTAEKISDMAENATFGMSELAENAVIAAQSAKESPIKYVEMQVEDDFNMIDGIINNGSKEDLEKARTDLVSSIETAQQLAKNPFIRQEIRDLAVQDIENLQKSLDKIENAMQLSETAEAEYSDDWLNKMVLDGKAEIDDKGGFRINTDFYKKLDYADRHIEPMTENQAMTVMQALTLAGVEFSAVSRGDDKVALTVAEKDVSKLSDIMKTSVGKTVHRTAARSEPPEKYQTINPDYYAALAKNQRSTQIESHDVANAVMDSLTKSDVLYSAVVRKNGTTAITVAKENADTYKQIAETVKSERAVQTVKKSERPPQKRQQTAGKTAYFSRKQLKNEVQRISGQGKKNQKSKDNHLDK
jgi:transcriptional regulator NrdR family protein